MANNNPLEKVIERKVCAFAREHKILEYKFTSPSRRSVPDRIFVLQGGRVFWIEFKRRGEKPTPAQAVEIARIKAQGGTVYVVDDVQGGKDTISMELEFALP